MKNFLVILLLVFSFLSIVAKESTQAVTPKLANQVLAQPTPKAAEKKVNEISAKVAEKVAVIEHKNEDSYVEMLSITAGEKRVLQVPFQIVSCKSNSSNVKIERVNGDNFEISGVTAGRAVIMVKAGGMEKKYNITVFNSTLQTYQELSRLLEELPEVTLELHDGGLILRGVITNPAHWHFLRNIMSSYKQNCKSYVRFMPDAKLIGTLKKQFENANYPVVAKAGPQYPGKLSLIIAGNVLTVKGYLQSAQAIENVKLILNSQQWLNPEWNGDNFRVVTDLKIAPTQIDLGVVFVGVTKTQLQRLGNASANGTVLSWDVRTWFNALYGGLPEAISSHGEQHVGGSVLLDSSLKGTLAFFGSNGISDFRDAGHITLTNSGEEASFKSGGTRYIKLLGQDSVSLKEVEFGISYKAKALLQENNMVKIDLDIERSLPPVAEGDDYVQQKTNSKTSLHCPIGKTAIIAGQKELTFRDDGPKGYAFLRHIPIINWFASSKENEGSQIQILILISPELMHQNVKLSTVPSQENATLERDIYQDVTDKNQKVLDNEKKSWFQKMFTW